MSEDRLVSVRRRARAAALPVFTDRWPGGASYVDEGALEELDRIVDGLLELRQRGGLRAIRGMQATARAADLRQVISPDGVRDPTTNLRGGLFGLGVVAEAAADVIIAEFARGAVFRGAAANPGR